MGLNLHPNVTVTLPSGDDVNVVGGNLILDSLAVPYGAASVELPYTPATSLEPLDPRSGARVVVTGRDDWVGSSRTADLHIRTRTVDHDAKTVRLDLATDEALAMDYATLQFDRTPLEFQSNLRDVCNYVLGQIPGLTGNKLANSDFNAHIGGYWMTTGHGSVQWSGVTGVAGTVGTLGATITTTGAAVVYSASFTVTPGQKLSASLYVRTGGSNPAVGRKARVRIMYTRGSSASANGTDIDLTGSFQRITCTTTVPADATAARVEMVSTNSSVLGTIIMDRWQAEDGDVTEWRDGQNIIGGANPIDVTAYWPVTNLVPNPAVRSVVGNWIAGGTNGTLVRETGWRESPRPRPQPGGITPRAIPELPGVSTVTLTTWTGSSGLGQGGAYANTTTVVPYIPVRPWTTYTVSCWALTPKLASVELKAQIFGDDGAVLDAGKLIQTVTLQANTWTRIEGQITTGANAGRLGPFLYRSTGNQWTTGDALRTTAWMTYEGDRSVPFFDGATPNGGGYTYAASGAANASASTRTPTTVRDPELFDWQPGETAWDFLQPMLSATGYRLFCDEKRVWRFVNPATYTTPGVLSLSPLNLILGVDSISRNDSEVFATGVVIRYSYRDQHDVPQLAYDVAGDGQKVVVFEYARAYPGPGAAARILARRNGTGRTQDVEALIDWSASPAMQASVTLPDAPEQRGKVMSIRFALDAQATMVVGTSGLVDIIPGTIDALTGTIDALVGTIDAL